MGRKIIQPRMVPEIIEWRVVVSAFEYTVALANIIGKELPGLRVNIAYEFPRPSAGRTRHFDARTGVVKSVSVISVHNIPILVG